MDSCVVLWALRGLCVGSGVDCFLLDIARKAAFDMKSRVSPAIRQQRMLLPITEGHQCHPVDYGFYRRKTQHLQCQQSPVSCGLRGDLWFLRGETRRVPFLFGYTKKGPKAREGCFQGRSPCTSPNPRSLQHPLPLK